MERGKAKPILVIGSLNMDLVATATQLPKEGETVFGQSFATFPGGKGANQAAAAGKLGAEVYMAGCVGKDGFGKALISELESNGIATKFVRTVDTATGTALITVNETGANTIVVVAGANGCCDAADVDRSLHAFTNPGILLLQHEIPKATVEYAIHKAKELGWMVILNPAPMREISPTLYPKIDLLTPNESEAAALAKTPIGTKQEAITAAQKLRENGIKEVVITLGEAGAVWVHAEGQEDSLAYKVQAIDTTAAGDSYTAAIAVALAEGKSMQDALRFAAQTAAIAVTRHGAQSSLPTRQEVEAFAALKKGM